jgi:hypothetical protein
MADGDKKASANCAVGQVTGTGASIDIVCGFRPLWVKVLNKTGLATLEWNAIMADANGVKIVDSGSNATNVVDLTSLGITPLFNGFRIGADTDVNVSAEEIFWIAGK